MMGTYKDKSPEWRKGLRHHLLRAEIEYVAKNGGGCISFFQGHLASVHIKSLGFRIKRTFPWKKTYGLKPRTA